MISRGCHKKDTHIYWVVYEGIINGLIEKRVLMREKREIRVLHVDDAPDFLASLKVSLERVDEDFSIDTATSVETGLKLVKDGKYNLVISGYKMPGLDGLGFLHDLRQSGNKIPFIILTGEGSEEVAMKALNRGANRYLKKDVDVKSLCGTLAQAIKEEVERKRAEDELSAVSSYTRSLIEASLDPFVVINAEGKVMDVNQATELVTGVSRERLIESDFSDFFTEPEKARAGYQRVLSNGLVRDYPLRIHNASGSMIDVLYNATVYRNDAGEIQGVFATARDITERKQAEEALQMANAYNRSLIEAGLDPLVTIDPEGKIRDVNGAAEFATGYSREELIGTDFSNYFTEPDKARAGYQQVFQEGQVRDYPLAIQHRDGHIIPVLYNATVYRDDAGKVIGIFAAARDITERKRAEDQIRASLKEKEILLREVHHRVKNNLEVISSLLDMSSLRTQNQEALNLFKDARLKIFTIANIHSQLYKSDRFDQIDMESHVQELVNYISEVYAGRKEIAVVIEVANIRLPITRAIPSALVLNELISNAYKHAFTGRQEGNIEISIQKSDDDTIFMRVKDDGIGIPEEIDIYNIDSLGLTLVRSLVQHQLKGEIEIERNKGTEFIIEFKILEEEAERA